MTPAEKALSDRMFEARLEAARRARIRTNRLIALSFILSTLSVLLSAAALLLKLGPWLNEPFR